MALFPRIYGFEPRLRENQPGLRSYFNTSLPAWKAGAATASPAAAVQINNDISQLTTDMGRTRLLVFTQADDGIPLPFFIVLVFWLVVIFASSSLFAEPGPIVIASTLVFALSVSSALFLIVDLSHPFNGLMQVSNHHLHMVLPTIE